MISVSSGVKDYCDSWRDLWAEGDPDSYRISHGRTHGRVIDSVLRGDLDLALRPLLMTIEEGSRKGHNYIFTDRIWAASETLRKYSEAAIFKRNKTETSFSTYYNYPEELKEPENSKVFTYKNRSVSIIGDEIGDSFRMNSSDDAQKASALMVKTFGIDCVKYFTIGSPGRLIGGTWSDRRFDNGLARVYFDYPGHSYLLFTFMMLNSIIPNEEDFSDLINSALPEDRTINCDDVIYAILTRRAAIFDDLLIED